MKCADLASHCAIFLVSWRGQATALEERLSMEANTDLPFPSDSSNRRGRGCYLSAQSRQQPRLFEHFALLPIAVFTALRSPLLLGIPPGSRVWLHHPGCCCSDAKLVHPSTSGPNLVKVPLNREGQNCQNASFRASRITRVHGRAADSHIDLSVAVESVPPSE
jgi:hypothetical protein